MGEVEMSTDADPDPDPTSISYRLDAAIAERLEGVDGILAEIRATLRDRRRDEPTDDLERIAGILVALVSRLDAIGAAFAMLERELREIRRDLLDLLERVRAARC